MFFDNGVQIALMDMLGLLLLVLWCSLIVLCVSYLEKFLKIKALGKKLFGKTDDKIKGNKSK